MRRIPRSPARRERGRDSLRSRLRTASALARSWRRRAIRRAGSIRRYSTDAGRRHSRRHGAQHPGETMRLPLGVPRPAGCAAEFGGKRILRAYIARVARPKLTRYAKDAYIETISEVEVPGLAAGAWVPSGESGAEARPAPIARSACLLRPRPASSRRAGAPTRRLRPGLDRSGAPAGRIYRDRADGGGDRLHASARGGIELRLANGSS